jgi:hypothetical protein
MPVTALSIQAALSPSQTKGGAMTSTDQKKQARTIVSERLRLFFHQLQEELASSTVELWKRIETQISGGKKEP